jgi:hypothetical protein
LTLLLRKHPNDALIVLAVERCLEQAGHLWFNLEK